MVNLYWSSSTAPTILVRLIVLAFTFCLVNALFGQNFQIEIKNQYSKAPAFVSKSPIKLSEYLTANDSSDAQKALNIYVWIVNNIRYDVKALRKIKANTFNPKQTLKRRKGVCYQYSDLFTVLAQNAGISARTITGYSRGFSYHEDDTFYEENHSWNGVKIDSAWYLLDATWGSGNLVQKNRWFRELLFKLFKAPYLNTTYKFVTNPNYSYFLVLPEKLIAHHLPADPAWQLVEFPISVKTFESPNWHMYIPKMDTSYAKQVDSIQYIWLLDRYEFPSELQFLTSSADNALIFNPKNHKPMGVASYLSAKSTQHTSGSLEEKLEEKNESLEGFRTAISHLQHHQRIAASESAKMTSKLKNRISTELIKPSRTRIQNTTQSLVRAQKFLSKQERTLENYANQISKYEDAHAKRTFKPFDLAIRQTGLPPEMTQKNQSTIELGLIEVVGIVDSLSKLALEKKGLTSRKHLLQEVLQEENNMLNGLINQNTTSISMNFPLRHISRYMNSIDSIGSYIDSLNIELLSVEKALRKNITSTSQFYTSLISTATEVQKLVIQFAQTSSGWGRQEFDTCTNSLKFADFGRIQLQKELLATTQRDIGYTMALEEILSSQLNTLEVNSRFISFYQKSRIGGVLFKKRRSDFETGKLIRNSQKELRKLSGEISKTKKEIRQSKSENGITQSTSN